MLVKQNCEKGGGWSNKNEALLAIELHRLKISSTIWAAWNANPWLTPRLVPTSKERQFYLLITTQIDTGATRHSSGYC